MAVGRGYEPSYSPHPKNDVATAADFADVERSTVTPARRNIQARLDALDAGVASYFAAAGPAFEHARRPIDTALNDARSLLNIRSETEDYLVPFALMFLEKAERQFARAKTLSADPLMPRCPRLS